MKIELQAEILNITDEKLTAYLSRPAIIPEVWSALARLLENAGAYNVDWIDWSTAPSHIELTVNLGTDEKVQVLTVLREYIKNIILLSSIQEGQCFRVNHPDWECRLKMVVKRIYKNGTVSLKSLSTGYKEVTVKLNGDNFDEYQLTKTKW